MCEDRLKSLQNKLTEARKELTQLSENPSWTLLDALAGAAKINAIEKCLALEEKE